MSTDQLGYDGKVVIITGAGGGLGRQHALLLASRGALVVINDLGGSIDGSGSDKGAAEQVADEHGQHVMSLARDYIGAAGMLAGGDGDEFVPGTDTKSLGPDKPDGGLMHAGWYDGFMFSQALTIGGGTFAVQRNIIGELVLGLPRDTDATRGLSWAEAQRAGGRSE